MLIVQGHRKRDMPTTHSLSPPRKLLAVAMVDIAGYSRMMERDELGTHARVDQTIHDVVMPALATHGGRLVDRAGDGLLLCFESSIAAVRCSLVIQNELACRNEQIDPGKQIRLRIGINVGDVIVAGERIVGDGVNVAARLQELASPGEICISDSVRDQVRDELDVPAARLGDVRVKNIARPIRAHRIMPQGAVKSRPRPFGTGRRPLTSMVLGVVLATAAAWITVTVDWKSLPWTAGTQRARPVGMSLAVMPFSVKREEDRATAAEVSQQVTRGLARTPWIQVAALPAAPGGPDLTRNVQSIGQDLHVRYVVLGAVTGGAVGIGAEVQLIDVVNSTSAWDAHVEPGRGWTAQELAASIVVQLRDAIYLAETRRFVASGAAPSTPMEYKILGDKAIDQGANSLPANLAARRLYEAGAKVDADFVPGLISLGYTYVSELDLNPRAKRDEIVHRLDDLSAKVVYLDPESAPAWQFRSEALARQWRWEAALAASERSLELDGGRAWGFSQRASLLVRIGRPQDALRFVQRALTLTEQKHAFATFQECQSHLALGAYAAATAACERSTARLDWWMPHAFLAASYALQDDMPNAEREKGLLLKLMPDVSIRTFQSMQYSNHPEYLHQLDAHLYAGLRRLGLAGE